MSTTSPAEKDFILWKSSVCINPQEALPSPWLFDYDSSTLLVLHLPNPTAIQLCQMTFTFCALLDIHNSYWSCDSPHLGEIKQLSQISLYHARLKSSVEADLLLQHQKDADKVMLPEVMSPWVDRTIFLFPHDDDGRKAFGKYNHTVSSTKLQGRMNSFTDFQF
jgi:hypothetical protein